MDLVQVGGDSGPGLIDSPGGRKAHYGIVSETGTVSCAVKISQEKIFIYNHCITQR